jgi:hypothetical protein
MIEEGIDFDTVKDINKLCLYLGSDMRKVRLIDISISLIIGVINALIVFLLTHGKNLYFLYVFVVLISIGIYLLLHFIKNFNKRRSEYIDSIKKKYDELFDTYLGYDKYLIGFVQNSKNKFRTNTAILLTNGYKIVITEDPFASDEKHNFLVWEPLFKYWAYGSNTEPSNWEFKAGYYIYVLDSNGNMVKKWIE